MIRDWQAYCTKQNFIGEGTTRISYKLDNFVIKKHVHEIGYLQSLNEKNFYEELIGTGLEEQLPEIYHVSEEFSLEQYIKPIPLYEDGSGFDLNLNSIDEEESEFVFHPRVEELLDFLKNKGVIIDDVLYSKNAGIKNDIISFFDFGFTNELMKRFQKEVDKGIIPIFTLRKCKNCTKKFSHKTYKGKEPKIFLCKECEKY